MIGTKQLEKIKVIQLSNKLNIHASILYISNRFQLAADAVFPEMMRIGKSKAKMQSFLLIIFFRHTEVV